MNLTDLVSTFRLDMADQVEPFLWSTPELQGYFDDAQKQLCRLTDGIGDARTPEVTQLVIEPDTSWVDLHPSILKIRGATRADDGRPVPVINFEDMAPRGWRFTGQQGGVRALVIGEEAHAARVWPTSGEDVTINLLVWRLPLAPLSEAEPELEIAEQHHRHLLLWAKHLAYSKPDADTYDKTKAAEFEQRFYAYCDQAKTEARRAAHKPRTVAYGGL